MNELPYKFEHLREYTGILTSKFSNGKFKMELKLEDNPVVKERWSEKNVSRIELEFHYNLGPSSSFFHHIFSCPKYNKREQCDDCDNIRRIDTIFETNLKYLQVGDTFKIMAALMNNDESVLPAEIHSFENYQPLLAAGTDRRLRLPDTPEGINHKSKLEQQRLQGEREAEEKRKEEEEQARKDARLRERKEKFQQFFGDSPYITQITTSAIGGLISGIIIATIVEPIPRLFRWIISFF